MALSDDLTALAVGEWLKAPVQTGSKISGVFASPNPGGTQATITSSWGGGCYDSLRDEFIIHGGGHGDYSGNEFYAFSISTATWRIKAYYSTPRDATGDIRYADGTPPSAHTYTCLTYLPSTDRILRLPGLAPYTLGSAFFSTHVDSLDASVESPATAIPGSWTAKANDADGNSDGIWAYNSLDGKFYGMYSGGSSSQGIRHYDPVGNAHTTDTTFDSGAANNAHNMTAAIAPVGVGYMAYMGGSLQMKKLSDFTFAGTSDATYGATGATAIEGIVAPGFVWDPLGEQFVAWGGTLAGGTDNRDWYTLPDPTSGSKVWTRHTGTGDIPPNPVTNGTYSRFMVRGSTGICALVNSTADEVYFLRVFAPPTAEVTGTATASITEADIVAGGKTIIVTLSDETYVAAAGTPTYSAATTKGTTAADSAGGGGGRTSNGDLTCTFPSGYTPTAGHFALMIVYSDQGSGSLPSGWSQVTGSPFGAGTEKLNIFYKVLAGGESDPVTTISGSTTNMSHCANMVIYTGVGSIGAIGTASNGTGTPMTAAAITTTVNNAIVCACSGRGDNENAGSQTFNASSTGVAERLDGGTAAGNDAQVSMADISIATAASSSGAASSTTSATDPWVSVQIELKPSTPFNDARQAFINGIDSAQSESGGWDAKVKATLSVTTVARTSDTVATLTLPAVADFNITATETLTDTIPASILTGGAAIVATPTFTISASVATAIPNKITGVRQAVKRSSFY